MTVTWSLHSFGVRRVLVMFSNGWQLMQTRSIVCSAALENCSSSSGVSSPTLLVSAGGSGFGAFFACPAGADAPIAIVPARITNAPESSQRVWGTFIFTIVKLPFRDRPQEDTVALDRHGPFRRPFGAHVEHVRDDARTGFELTNELGAKALVDALQEIERDDAR